MGVAADFHRAFLISAAVLLQRGNPPGEPRQRGRAPPNRVSFDASTLYPFFRVLSRGRGGGAESGNDAAPVAEREPGISAAAMERGRGISAAAEREPSDSAATMGRGRGNFTPAERGGAFPPP